MKKSEDRENFREFWGRKREKRTKKCERVVEIGNRGF